MISSRSNDLVRHARAARKGRINNIIFIEGIRLCEEAIKSHLNIEDVLYTNALMKDERGRRLLSALSESSRKIALVSEPVLASISDTKTPQGLIILAQRPHSEFEPRGANWIQINESSAPLIVIMHRINNPANAGAILRTAEAAGVTAVVATENTTDLFSPKALRGAMGSSFRVPLWTGASFSNALGWCSAHNLRTVCADIRARRSYTEMDWTKGCALILGSESVGLEATEVAKSDETVRIPMCPPVESLNVSVASAILLYETFRQRNAG